MAKIPAKVARKGNRESAKVRAEKADKRAADLKPVMIEVAGAANAKTLAEIAAALNAAGVPTLTGVGKWTAIQVARVGERLRAVEAQRAPAHRGKARRRADVDPDSLSYNDIER